MVRTAVVSLAAMQLVWTSVWVGAAEAACQSRKPALPAAHRRAAHRGRYRYGAYFVPPPPAYMPSILPELAVRQDEELLAARKAGNPYRKYIYSRQGYELPQPVQSRKGVTVWTSSS